MQIIFQDPVGSLNPHDGGEHHRRADCGASAGGEARRAGRVAQLLERVGLPAAAANRYPHEFSGGQRQRIGITCGRWQQVLQPSFIVCVMSRYRRRWMFSIQAQVLNLLQDLQKEVLGLAYLFGIAQ